MLYGKAPIIFGDGSVTRDFFYVKDTARALSDLMEIKNISAEIINIGTGEEITMKVLMEQLIEAMGLTGEMKIDFQEDRPADVPRLWVDPSKFNRITNFKASVTFSEGLKETIEYYKNLMSSKDMLSEIQVKNWEK